MNCPVVMGDADAWLFDPQPVDGLEGSDCQIAEVFARGTLDVICSRAKMLHKEETSWLYYASIRWNCAGTHNPAPNQLPYNLNSMIQALGGYNEQYSRHSGHRKT